MDFFTSDWMSDNELELVDAAAAAAFIPRWEMNPVDEYSSVENENLDVINNIFSPTTSYYNNDPAAAKTNDQQLLFNKNNKDSFYNSGSNWNAQKAKIIAFGDTTTSPPAKYYNTGINNNVIKIEGGHDQHGTSGSFEEIMSFDHHHQNNIPIISTNSEIQKLYTQETTVKKGITRATLQAQQDHVVAERKRREKLSELFISLSTMIPGLKKLDKASILGGTIEHLKQLEGRLKTLEKQQQKKRKMKMKMKDDHDHMDASNSSDDANLCYPIPHHHDHDHGHDHDDEIEVRESCDGNVLLRINCHKKKGVIKEILCEVEKIGLCIINSSAIPFGDTTLQISVIAQMNEDFCLFGESLKDKVRKAILKLL